jgi:hypothetical protein
MSEALRLETEDFSSMMTAPSSLCNVFRCRDHMQSGRKRALFEVNRGLLGGLTIGTLKIEADEVHVFGALQLDVPRASLSTSPPSSRSMRLFRHWFAPLTWTHGLES